MICCDMNLLSNVQIILVESCEFDVVLYYQHCQNVLNFTSLFQRCSNVVVHHQLNLLSNVEAGLEQRCGFDIVVSTSL